LSLIDGIRWFDFECNEDNSWKECTIPELLASKDETLLIRRSMSALNIIDGIRHSTLSVMKARHCCVINSVGNFQCDGVVHD
jgi:hypothetical protein